MENYSLEILGKRLKEVREALQLKQSEVANSINKKQATISAIESGKNGGIDTLFSIFNLYKDHVYIPDLFGETFDFYYSNQKQKDINIEKDLNQEKKKLIIQKLTEVVETYY